MSETLNRKSILEMSSGAILERVDYAMGDVMNIWDIPEPRLEPPDPPPFPRCPVCGAETDTFYKDNSGDIVGCDECVTTVDAWEWGAP